LSFLLKYFKIKGLKKVLISFGLKEAQILIRGKEIIDFNSDSKSQ
jgi:hypothetical protein